MHVSTPVADVQQVRARLSQHAGLLKRYGVRRLAVFGSVVRGMAKGDSDVDILVEFESPIGMFAFLRLERELATVLGRRVDLVTEAALKPRMHQRILDEAIDAA